MERKVKTLSQITMAIVLSNVAEVLIGCAGIDLVPQSSDLTGSFCNLQGPSEQLSLIVTVKNQGTANAPTSLTTIQFLGVPAPGAPPITSPTPPIAAGASITLPPVPVPECGAPNCSADIIVDSANTVRESNENNNVLKCLVRIG